MRDQAIPVFVDEKSSTTAQYDITIQGIRAAASRCGLRINLVLDRGISGVHWDTLPPVNIITGADMRFLQSVITHLRENGRSAVLAGTDSEQFGHDVSCATPSRRTETQQLVNYLFNCGKRRLALVGFGRNSINDNFRYHAAMSAVAAWGQPLAEEDVYLWRSEPQECFARFLDVWQRYDAVICPNDVMSVCLINCCKAHGVRVPQDLYVASFGNMVIGRYFCTSITSMTMDMRRVGEQAFNVWRFLTASKGMETSLKMTVPGRILVRESTAFDEPEENAIALTPTPKADQFYSDPGIAVLLAIENCLSRRDELDMRIIKGIMGGKSYEQLSGELFISSSTLRYRLHKIFLDANVKGRQAFETLVHEQLGGDNPFASIPEVGV